MPRHLFLLAISGLAMSGCNLIEPKKPVIADIRHDYTRCHVHNRTLLEDLQPAAWRTTERIWPEREALFPFAMNDICLHGPDNIEFARVMYCPECRAAKAEWLEREHR